MPASGPDRECGQRAASRAAATDGPAPGDRYKWVALSNTTAAVFMSQVDGSILIIALPAIFRHAVAQHIGALPPVSSLFAAVLGVNPIQHLLARSGALSARTAAARQTVTGREFFPHLISGPFHQGVIVLFAVAAGLAGVAAVAAIASLLRGPRSVVPRLGEVGTS